MPLTRRFAAPSHLSPSPHLRGEGGRRPDEGRYNRSVSESDPVIRNVSDTARWTAAFRARETERPDALFRDPLARKLAGERGESIARQVTFGTKHTWSWITRTYLVDRFLEDEIQRGADMVINLAAGLDTRPYRMELPPSLQWIEVDLPGILEYKEEMRRAVPIEKQYTEQLFMQPGLLSLESSGLFENVGPNPSLV